MPDRLDVLKTYKLFVDGKFPRSESGRSWPIANAKGSCVAHVSKASRKDLREAVEAARRAQPGWAGSSGYLRGQILYRLAEMMEGKREELGEALGCVGRAAGGLAPKTEVSAAIDRVVYYAGWADKYAQVLGCNNPVAGPHYNFSVPEACGVVAAVAPDGFPLLGLISLVAPALCAGNTVVCVPSGRNPIGAAVLAEACATSDLPPGVVNILPGERAELIRYIAEHRDIDAVHAANLSSEDSASLRRGAAENVKRVTVREGTDFTDADACQSAWWIEPFVEIKTIWHPSGA